MRLLASGLTQCVGDRPAPLKTFTNGRTLDACDFRPFYHRHTFSSQRKDATGSSISSLFFSGRPPAILGRVAFRVVDAIQRVFQTWAWAHVFQKCLNGILPLWAHRNAATSVPAIARIVGIITTLEHASPTSIFWASRHSMFGKKKAGDFFHKAAAAASVSAAQATRTNDNCISADATAQPSEIIGFCSRWLQHYKPSEFLIGKIAQIHADILYQKLGKARV